jgi:hypothetical protein
LGISLYIGSASGFACALILRGGAILYGWTIPRYRPRPGRDPDDVMKKR